MASNAFERVDVTGHYDNSVGSTDAASAGVITRELIDDRPLLRPGEVLEYIPGMIVTQHSGAGKGISIFCVASTSTMAPTLRPVSPAFALVPIVSE